MLFIANPKSTYKIRSFYLLPNLHLIDKTTQKGHVNYLIR